MVLLAHRPRWVPSAPLFANDDETHRRSDYPGVARRRNVLGLRRRLGQCSRMTLEKRHAYRCPVTAVDREDDGERAYVRRHGRLKAVLVREVPSEAVTTPTDPSVLRRAR